MGACLLAPCLFAAASAPNCFSAMSAMSVMSALHRLLRLVIPCTVCGFVICHRLYRHYSLLGRRPCVAAGACRPATLVGCCHTVSGSECVCPLACGWWQRERRYCPTHLFSFLDATPMLMGSGSCLLADNVACMCWCSAALNDHSVAGWASDAPFLAATASLCKHVCLIGNCCPICGHVCFYIWSTVVDGRISR